MKKSIDGYPRIISRTRVMCVLKGIGELCDMKITK